MDPYAEFLARQEDKVARTREIERFRRRFRWWTISLVLATVLFTVLLVVGELT